MYSSLQQYQIDEGIKSMVDVSIYKDSEFSEAQMYQIRKGLEKGLDVSCYANTCYCRLQMYVIQRFLSLKRTDIQMKEI